jgi:hypothetical protein
LMDVNYAVTTTIVPSNPYEIVQPFQLGTGGFVATTNDPVQQAVSHILAVALTRATERPMRPSYGVGLQSMLFSNSPLSEFQTAAGAMQKMYASQESTSFVTSVSVTRNSTDPSSYVFSVAFALDQTNDVHAAIFDYAGTLVGTE